MSKIKFKILLAAFFICVGISTAKAVEQADLSTAYIVNPSSTTILKVVYLALDWENSTISIGLKENGVHANFNYSGPTARTMLIVLNKANLTSNSLHKRILNQLISDGFISGSVSGNPD